MAKVRPGEGRSTISNLGDGLQIVIPAKKNYFIIAFIGFWLAGWLFGEISVTKQLVEGNSGEGRLFLIAWLGMWTIGGTFALIIWLWNFKGKEIIRIDGMELQHVQDFLLFKRSKEYELSHISNVRVNPQANSLFNLNAGMEFWGLSGGAVAFDYGKSTYKFGPGLDEAEASHIVEQILKRYKGL